MELFKITFSLVAVVCWCSNIAAGRMCYTCDHVAHPRDCDRVIECQQGESCNVISYAQLDGHYYFTSGCVKTELCPTGTSAFGKRDIAFCNRCCDSDYCNKELCDAKETTEHGPRCLQCSTVEHPSHCGAVAECARGQVCYTREKYVFGELRYQLGCADPGCAPRTYRQVLQKRAGMCQQCCSGENCNRDLCKNTGSSLTQPPPTVVSSIPVVAQTTVAATPRPTIGNQITTTYPYNLGGCHYKGHVYAKGQTWDEGCSFRCTCEDDRTGRYVCQDICPTYVHMPTDCHLQKPPAGECCEKPVCQTSHITFTNVTTVNYTSPVLITKCLYKNQTYAQAAVWRDGCDYECTCVDASRGYYRCTSLCYSWNLPAECHLADPAPGKCCKTPECPVHFTINYPPGYVAN
ncbi:putative epidermal cell surface receptor [Mya arenaria]|uniref:putative epidermal cell surface receptor n=1 Tax=Mya arenaria TaxID=6604 RepID=UPI0022E051B7|nr:putative epidermal cell surface receptor [Mya arenaria]